jgi:hypothetical protein
MDKEICGTCYVETMRRQRQERGAIRLPKKDALFLFCSGSAHGSFFQNRIHLYTSAASNLSDTYTCRGRVKPEPNTLPSMGRITLIDLYRLLENFQLEGVTTHGFLEILTAFGLLSSIIYLCRSGLHVGFISRAIQPPALACGQQPRPTCGLIRQKSDIKTRASPCRGPCQT